MPTAHSRRALLATILVTLVASCTSASLQLLSSTKSATITVATPLSNCTVDAACGCNAQGDLAYLLSPGDAGRVAIVTESLNLSVSSSCNPNAQFKIEQMGTYVYFSGRTYPNDPQPGVVGTATVKVTDPATRAQCTLRVVMTVDGQPNNITEQPVVLEDSIVELSAPASCTSGSSCQCGVKGATQIHGQYHMQTLVSSSTKTLQLRTQSSNNDTGVIYSTQYQRTGSVSTPNQRLPWLQASTPTSRAAPIIIKADHNNPVPGARLRVDASVVSNQGVLCTVPIFVEFVGTLPVLPANGQAKPVQLLKNP